MESPKPPAKSFSAKELVIEAVKREKAGEKEAAVAFYLKAIESNLTPPASVYCRVINLLSNLGRLDVGLLLGERALIAHSQSPEVYQALEVLYQEPVETFNYLNHYQQLLAFEPQQSDWLYYNLARQLWQSDRPSEAIEVGEKGVELHKSFHPLHYLLGNVFAELEQWDKAIAFYQRVKELAPNWLEVEQKLDRVLYHQSQIEDSTPSEPKSSQSIIQNVESPVEPIANTNRKYHSSDLEPIFARLEARQLSLKDCRQIWHSFSGSQVNLDYGCWLSSSILYLEIAVNDHEAIDNAKILACSSSTYGVAKVDLIQISPQQILGVACFPDSLDLERNQSYRLCIHAPHATTIFVLQEVAQTAYGLEFIDYLKTKADAQKHLIRESLSRAIIKLIPQNHQSEAGDILKKLQYFLDIAPRNYIEPNLPFKIFIDYIIPLKSDGLFITGWLQDAYEMLEKITIISALGFSLELSNQDIYRIERNDVEQFLQNTRYGDFEADFGFCAYAPVPQEIRNSIAGFAQLHSFRFIVELEGNIKIEIIPDAKYGDLYNARQKVMQIASPSQITPAMMNNCIAPVGLKLQQLCIEQVKIKEIVEFGSIEKDPLASIIIPLYRRLDFMKVQLATMANDRAIALCEIIYVLDSPEQEEELKTLLANYCTLYQLPVKLVIMERNSGYAAANNAGASQATGRYLVLLNSDVFAKTKGWVTKMAYFYASSDKIGALGAKLLYEDDSLQHAGMFFAQTTYPFWLTLHYYKGLPGNYPLAQKTRAVPAVTGACLMISKKLYDQVGGFTTDYIIGDFEDSDLCFKCRQLGYESWYYADVSLYHLERQSVPLNSSYNDSLAWLLNGRIHQKLWGKEIEQVMKEME